MSRELYLLSRWTYDPAVGHLPPPPELSVVHLNSELVRSTSSDQGAEAEAHNVFTISIPLYGGGNITSIEIML